MTEYTIPTAKPCGEAPGCGESTSLGPSESEWKGPWKCTVCGFIGSKEGHEMWWVQDQRGCLDPQYVPFDRRAPNPLLPLVKELREALRQTEWCDKSCALGDLHCPICGRPDMAKHKEDCSVGIALAHADKALEEEKR